MEIFTKIAQVLGPVALVAKAAGEYLGNGIIKAVDAVFDAAEKKMVEH
jgi:hypothetical protein